MMEFAICTVAAGPLRKEPAHRSEMVNQLLFGEIMQVLEVKDEWLKIQTIQDRYEGWLTNHLVTPITGEQAKSSQDCIAGDVVNNIMCKGQPMVIPMGSVLTGLDVNKKTLWTEDYQYQGNYKRPVSRTSGEMILETARKLINAPYLWGGKTIMGIDCSGFAQTVFRLNGINLPRDAWQQEQQGTSIAGLSAAQQADLAFFSNENAKIVHVGILLGSTQIIHASGRVRIDTIDDEGIIHSDTGKRTHRLHSIKRFL